jgi:hypothetical protein
MVCASCAQNGQRQLVSDRISYTAESELRTWRQFNTVGVLSRELLCFFANSLVGLFDCLVRAVNADQPKARGAPAAHKRVKDGSRGPSVSHVNRQ